MKAAELLDTAGGRIIYPAGGDESVGSGVKKQSAKTKMRKKIRAKIDLLAHFEAKLAKIFFAGAPPPHPRRGPPGAGQIGITQCDCPP